MENLSFVTVRCELCRKKIGEIANSTNGRVRLECSRCKTVSTFGCKTDLQPVLLETSNKRISSDSSMRA